MAEKTGSSKARYTLMKALQKTDKFLKRGADIFETVSKVGANPGVSTVVHAGMRLTQQALGLGFFDALRINRWPVWYPSASHRDCFFELLDTFPRKVFGENSDDTVTFYDFYDKTIARLKGATYLNYLEGETDYEELNDLFSQAVWDKIGSPCTMIASGGGNKEVSYRYMPAAPGDVYESELCTKVIDRIRPFVERDISRSVMLYGPPGTGKSCIVNGIAAAFGKKQLFIDVSNLNYCNSSTLTNYIVRMQPDVLIINDLDRFSGSGQMLTTIEDLNKSLKLLLVTVNNKKHLPTAVLRPGRFDEMIEVVSLDANVALGLVGIPRNEIPDAMFEELVTWPAAFINELGKRIKYLGKENLVEEFSSLQQRVAENNPKKEEEKKAAGSNTATETATPEATSS